MERGREAHHDLIDPRMAIVPVPKELVSEVTCPLTLGPSSGSYISIAHRGKRYACV